ncbi:gluconate 2-dehydrogenase subunit 3 family protein [Pelagicoccus sp. SDUM812002]|uniref:gluconate 2-dehydrogenase subunit 3 family protein n=1 Tax=Pelagicoccus sp. SDUM812002 TaxID=3041266 RepID=UPI00280E4935|nr:gluconate 2-dehydrogenase subunit 3 family protein [Pelagicoccus sp. SDUM812002]MDQ8185792.1 gluconate 2-dehydrogenase subunit 3 family protein [Pelagicoccus sp. SDUM812002]
MSNQDTPTRASRRSAITWMLDASRTMPFLYGGTLPEKPIAFNPKADLWSRTFSKTQLPLVAALTDIIIPGDDDSPSASDLKIPDFIDEWISAPYPLQQKDRGVMLEGLGWINKESRKRFKKGFTKLSRKHQLAICNDISDPSTAKPIYESAVAFFLRFQKLTFAAYYTTEIGKEHLGDSPLPTFELPAK